MIDENEVFHPLFGYEGLYEINKNGVVRTLPYDIIYEDGRKKTAKPKIKTIHTYKSGYTYTGLSKNKKEKLHTIHRLLANTFIPNPENKPYVNHINGIKNDNRLENLEWVTASENEIHKYNVLKSINGRRKLSYDDIYDIWHNIKIINKDETDKRKRNFNLKEMADKYGVKEDLIYTLLSGQLYRNTTCDFEQNEYRLYKSKSRLPLPFYNANGNDNS